MKPLYLIIFCIFSINIVYAQFPGGAPQNTITGKITATVIDSATRKPVEYATIALAKSGQTKSTNGSLADGKGFFKIENVRAGKYRLTVSFIGYSPKVIDPIETTLSKPDLNLG